MREFRISLWGGFTPQLFKPNQIKLVQVRSCRLALPSLGCWFHSFLFSSNRWPVLPYWGFSFWVFLISFTSLLFSSNRWPILPHWFFSGFSCFPFLPSCSHQTDVLSSLIEVCSDEFFWFPLLPSFLQTKGLSSLPSFWVFLIFFASLLFLSNRSSHMEGCHSEFFWVSILPVLNKLI